MEGQDATPLNDSLESLGLVDPSSGKALPTADWAPGTQQPQGDADPNARDRYGEPRAEQGPSTQPPAGEWDSDSNPYKAEALRARQANDPAAQARQGFAQQAQSIDAQAQAAFAQMVSSGMPAEQAQVVIGAARAAALSDAQMKADRLALLPAAKREVADRIAREFSLSNAKIDSSEILAEQTVEGMRARARALQESRRAGAFAGRRASGADRVERGAGPGSKIDYEGLSPFDTIRLGIARGQFS